MANNASQKSRFPIPVRIFAIILAVLVTGMGLFYSIQFIISLFQ